jgi:hypothetical protein
MIINGVKLLLVPTTFACLASHVGRRKMQCATMQEINYHVFFFFRFLKIKLLIKKIMFLNCL